MNTLYNFVSGPLAWLAFILFFGGCLYRLTSLLVLVHRKEKFIYTYMSLKYGLRSILRWSTPFATENMRRHPALTIVAFAFHICLILAPLFFLRRKLRSDGTLRFRVFAYFTAIGLAFLFIELSFI